MLLRHARGFTRTGPPLTGNGGRRPRGLPCCTDGDASSISHNSKEKRQYTCLPAIPFSTRPECQGIFPEWQGILEGDTAACLPRAGVLQELDGKIYSTYSSNHWVNLKTTKEFVIKTDDYRKRICERLLLDPEKQVMILVLDAWRIWLMSECTSWIQTTFGGLIKIVRVPATCTLEFQPLDGHSQSIIKNSLQTQCEDFLFSSCSEQLNLGVPASQVRLDVTLTSIKPHLFRWLAVARDAMMSSPGTVTTAWRMAKLGDVFEQVAKDEAHLAFANGELAFQHSAESAVEEDGDHMCEKDSEEHESASGTHDEQFGFEIVDAMTGTGEYDMEEAQAPAGETLTGGPKQSCRKLLTANLKQWLRFRLSLAS